MSKIKHTKNELKAQKDALGRYLRFLPMLQLKKQQLQMEVQTVTAAIQKKTEEADALRGSLQRWVRLLGENVELESLVTLKDIRLDEGNIAGTPIPLLREVLVERAGYDLWATPPWVDDAVEVLEGLIRLRVARETLAEQRRRVVEELRVTSQRVNLFEKVKIPECRENIRVIKIFLGDEQTAAVARGKIAKRRSTVMEEEVALEPEEEEAPA
jgi:V/A-type H+/Na+-transporting ATPase subunit D